MDRDFTYNLMSTPYSPLSSTSIFDLDDISHPTGFQTSMSWPATTQYSHPEIHLLESPSDLLDLEDIDLTDDAVSGRDTSMDFSMLPSRSESAFEVSTPQVGLNPVTQHAAQGYATYSMYGSQEQQSQQYEYAYAAAAVPMHTVAAPPAAAHTVFEHTAESLQHFLLQQQLEQQHQQYLLQQHLEQQQQQQQQCPLQQQLEQQRFLMHQQLWQQQQAAYQTVTAATAAASDATAASDPASSTGDSSSSSSSADATILLQPAPQATEQHKHVPYHHNIPSAPVAAAAVVTKPPPAGAAHNSSSSARFYALLRAELRAAGISMKSLRFPGRVRADARPGGLGPQESYRLTVRIIAVLLAIAEFTTAIYEADQIGNLTKAICDNIMQQVIGTATGTGLPYPQKEELTEWGAVCYVARFLSYYAGNYVSPLKLVTYFNRGRNGYELDYGTMISTDELGPRVSTRSWSLPLDPAQISIIPAGAPARDIFKPERLPKGQGKRAKTSKKRAAAAAPKAKKALKKPTQRRKAAARTSAAGVTQKRKAANQSRAKRA